MKHVTMALSFTAVTLSLAFSGQFALAQGSLIDAGKGLLSDSGNSGTAAGAMGGITGGGGIGNLVGALPLDKIMALLKEQGYSNIMGLAPSSSGDALQAKATNSSGSPVDLLINPSSGQVLSALTK